jgi:hypothetical protein
MPAEIATAIRAKIRERLLRERAGLSGRRCDHSWVARATAGQRCSGTLASLALLRLRMRESPRVSGRHALPKPALRAIFVAGSTFGSGEVPLAPSTSTDPPETRSKWPAAYAWAPAALLGAGVLLGVALWAKWGFAVAFDAIRAYCF